MKAARLSAVAIAAAALLAATAQARPWRVQTIATPGPALSRGLDVLPDGRAAVVLERSVGRSTRLELRIAGRSRPLDSHSRTFSAVQIAHDSRGRLVVTWSRYTGELFAWTAATRTRQIASAAADASLAVTPDGRAVLAYSTRGGPFVARGFVRSGFGRSESIGTTTSNATPAIAISAAGRIVVAWNAGDGVIALRSAAGGAPFGSTRAVRLRARDPGTVVTGQVPRIAMTSDGRAIVVVYSVLARGARIADARVEAFAWTVRAARPTSAATLSRGAMAGEPDVVASGKSARIAWTQQTRRTPRALWATRWTGKGPQRPNVYDTRALGGPVLLTVGRRDAVNAFYRAGGQRWFTVRLTAAGLYRGTSVVTPPGEEIAAIDVAAAGGRVAAAWTSGRGARVQLGRP
jgi:hypothetical protein